MPSTTHVDKKARLKAKLLEKKKHKTWNNKQGKAVKLAQEDEVRASIKQFKGRTCSPDLINDFQNSAVQTLRTRMRAELLTKGYIMVPVARTVFYTFVFPLLESTRFWSAHYGDWARPTFRTRLVGTVGTLKQLRLIFGAAFVCPKEQSDLAGYNTDMAKGLICV